jgi:flagellar hook-associated protein 2
MADVSVNSLSSQISTLVAQYQSSLRSTKVTPLENRKTTLNARLSALGNVKTRLQALFDTADGLTNTGTSSKFLSFSIASSLPSVATAAASTAASVGTHTLLVTQLAKADTALSNQLNSASTSIVTAEGAGVKTIQVGNKSVNVTLTGGDSNSTVISNIASAINAAGGNVTASVVSDTSSTSRLVLISTQTGSTNALTLSDTTGTLLANVGLNSTIISSRTTSSSTTAGFVYTASSSLNSIFKLDGIDIVRQTNTVSDVLSGVTFDLKAVQNIADTPATLIVGVNKDQVKSNVQTFVNDYNYALTYLKSATSVDPTNQVRQILAGDSAFVTLRINLQALAAQQVSSVQSGNPDVLYKIGITAGKDGTLSISDSAKFDAAIATDTVKLSDLFGSSSGIAVQMKTLLDGFVSSGGRADTALSDQLSSTATSIVTAEGAGVKTIQVGNKSVNVTLTGGDSNSTVISNIASAINAAGGNVTASVVSDTSSTNRLALTSTLRGSTNALTLSDTTGTLLANVGLNSTIISSRTTSSSTTAGFAYTATSSLDTKSRMDAAKDSVTSQVTGLTSKIKTMNERIARQVEKYRNDFARLQSAYAMATQQQQMITSLMSSISGG